MMNTTHTIGRALRVLALVSFAGGVQAASYNWNGLDGALWTVGPWNDTVPGSGNVAVFSELLAGQNVDVDATILPDFTGAYAPANWTVSGDDASVFWYTFNSPDNTQLQMGAPENDGYAYETVKFSATAAASGTWSFKIDLFRNGWGQDGGSFVNGVLTHLSTAEFGNWTWGDDIATVSIHLNAGDTFGYFVQGDGYQQAGPDFIAPDGAPRPTRIPRCGSCKR